ncbi:MAG: hypothetical protein II401_03335 [Bacteroidales bacterium]|nr:hypothetical protein [Bacteroidales bacterium]
MKNSGFLDNNYVKLIIVVIVFIAGWLIGKGEKTSFINNLNANPMELPAASPSVNYTRMYVYGNYYIVFTQSNGGMFVIKE